MSEQDERDDALVKAMARAAREHLEAEREEGGYNIRRAERERERRVKAEAEVKRLTRDLNEARSWGTENVDKWHRLHANKCEEVEWVARARDKAVAEVQYMAQAAEKWRNERDAEVRRYNALRRDVETERDKFKAAEVDAVIHPHHAGRILGQVLDRDDKRE